MEKNEEKVSLKDFIGFCKSHVLLICFTIVCVFLTHAPNIFSNSIGVDSQAFLENPTFDYNWLGIGRFGLLLEKQILGLSFFNPYYAGCIFILILMLSNVLLYYTIFKISNKDFGLFFLCIPMLVFTHPVFAEQFYFILQYAEISFGILITVLAVLLTFASIKERNLLYGVLAAILLIISFATYQSFVAMYICLSVAGYIFCYEENRTMGDKKTFIKVIALIILIFSVSLIAYQIIIKFLPTYNSHLNDNYFWDKYSKREVVKNILSYMKEVMLGERSFYNLGYLFGGIALIVISIIKSKNINKTSEKIVYILSIFGFLLTPFLLSIAIGHGQDVRGQLVLPFTEGITILLVSEYLFKNKYLKYVALVFIVLVFENQLFTIEQLYYTDYTRNKTDIQIAHEIASDISKLNLGEVPEQRIAFVGHREARLNSVCIKGETIGQSLFLVCYNAPPYYFFSTDIIVRLYRVLGIDYNPATEEQVKKARVYAKDMPVWPAEGGVKQVEDFIVVKLSEDELP